MVCHLFSGFHKKFALKTRSIRPQDKASLADMVSPLKRNHLAVDNPIAAEEVESLRRPFPLRNPVGFTQGVIHRK